LSNRKGTKKELRTLEEGLQIIKIYFPIIVGYTHRGVG